MEEQQVSIEGNQVDLPSPFFVIATQNPLEQSGTFPLPESQLDRFLIRLSIGYPSDSIEKQLLKRQSEGASGSTVDNQAVFTENELSDLIDSVDQVHVSDALIDYLQTLLSKTRSNGKFVTGLSPRAGLQWLQAAKAKALVEHRDMVLPEDIKYLAPFSAAHRLHCNDGSDVETELAAIIEQTEIL
jgi:MoxR-like ATPase